MIVYKQKNKSEHIDFVQKKKAKDNEIKRKEKIKWMRQILLEVHWNEYGCENNKYYPVNIKFFYKANLRNTSFQIVFNVSIRLYTSDSTLLV